VYSFSTAAVLYRVHILHDIEWEYIRVNNWELCIKICQTTVSDIRLDVLLYTMKIPVCIVDLRTGTNVGTPDIGAGILVK
jgi:hypothetical protein